MAYGPKQFIDLGGLTTFWEQIKDYYLNKDHFVAAAKYDAEGNEISTFYAGKSWAEGQLETKVTAKPNHSLVANTDIDKLKNLPADAEPNKIATIKVITQTTLGENTTTLVPDPEPDSKEVTINLSTLANKQWVTNLVNAQTHFGVRISKTGIPVDPPQPNEAGIIILVPAVQYPEGPSVEGENSYYDEYVWVAEALTEEGQKGKWERIGDTRVNLTDYAKTEDVKSDINAAKKEVQDNLNKEVTARTTLEGIVGNVTDAGATGGGTAFAKINTLQKAITNIEKKDGQNNVIEIVAVKSSKNPEGAAVDLPVTDGKRVTIDLTGIEGQLASVSAQADKGVKDAATAQQKAKANETAFTTFVGGDFTTLSGKVTANETAIGEKADATRVTVLEEAVGKTDDAAAAAGSIYARIKQNAADISTNKAAIETETTNRKNDVKDINDKIGIPEDGAFSSSKTVAAAIAKAKQAGTDAAGAVESEKTRADAAEKEIYNAITAVDIGEIKALFVKAPAETPVVTG